VVKENDISFILRQTCCKSSETLVNRCQKCYTAYIPEVRSRTTAFRWWKHFK